MKDALPVLVEVRPLKRFHLYVKFSDGVSGEIDLSRFAGRSLFVLWNDYSQFEKVTIGPEGELDWGNEIRLDGLEIYLKLTGKDLQDVISKVS